MAGKVLATVGGISITESDVNEFIEGLGQRGAAYNTPEGRKAILNQLVGNKLLLLDARRNLYEAEPAFREQLNKLKDTLLINYAGEKALSSANVKEEEVRAYYDENKAQFVAEESVNASHILVDTEEKANDILTKIKAGEITFEKAAREYSTCPSKDNGGNLGDFGRGQMVGEFDSAVFSMNEGEISAEPVKTQFGYHLIKLNSKKAASEVPYSEMREQIYGMLMGEKRRKAYESKINQLKIMYPVDMIL